MVRVDVALLLLNGKPDHAFCALINAAVLVNSADCHEADGLSDIITASSILPFKFAI